MAETLVRSRLHVEGNDDQHSVVHLLIHNGVRYDPEKFELSPPELPKLVQIKGIDPLIDGIETAVKTSTKRTVGFLLDADSPLIDRWRRVAHRLKNVGVPWAFTGVVAVALPEVFAREHGHLWTTIGVSDYGPWLISTSRSLIRCSRRGCRRHQRTYFRTSRS